MNRSRYRARPDTSSRLCLCDGVRRSGAGHLALAIIRHQTQLSDIPAHPQLRRSDKTSSATFGIVVVDFYQCIGHWMCTVKRPGVDEGGICGTAPEVGAEHRDPSFADSYSIHVRLMHSSPDVFTPAVAIQYKSQVAAGYRKTPRLLSLFSPLPPPLSLLTLSSWT